MRVNSFLLFFIIYFSNNAIGWITRLRIGPQGHLLNVSPARQGWVLNPDPSPSAVGAPPNGALCHARQLAQSEALSPPTSRICGLKARAKAARQG
jgi:hypothetical protein